MHTIYRQAVYRVQAHVGRITGRSVNQPRPENPRVSGGFRRIDSSITPDPSPRSRLESPPPCRLGDGRWTPPPGRSSAPPSPSFVAIGSSFRSLRAENARSPHADRHGRWHDDLPAARRCVPARKVPIALMSQTTGVDADHVYHDFASGVRDDRPGLDSCLRALRPGDVLVVWKLDRLDRNLAHLGQHRAEPVDPRRGPAGAHRARRADRHHHRRRPPRVRHLRGAGRVRAGADQGRIRCRRR